MEEKFIALSNVIKAFEHMYGIVFLMEFNQQQFIYRFVSPKAKELASLNDDCIGKSINDVYPDYIAEHIRALYEEARKTNKPVIVQDKFNMESVNEVAKLVVIPISEVYFISYTERTLIKEASKIDLLTGLPSYPIFIENLEKSLNNLSNQPVVLFYIKLLPINKQKLRKEMNQGTFVIELAKRIQAFIQIEEAQLARVIDDEMICFIKMGRGEGSKITELQLAISEPFLRSGIKVVMETAIGVTFIEVEGKTVNTLINEAYHAMLLAKKQKGNTISVFNEHRQTAEIGLKPSVENELFKAIEREEFKLFFQPIVHVETGKVHYEALLRWFSAKLGSVPPDAFIVVAENNGYIKEIDAWVIENVCKTVATSNWITKVSINLSTKTLELTNFEQTLLTICQKYEIHPNQIELELTEHSLLDDEKVLINKLCSLRKAGFQVAIDDFGMRHASFNYLRVLPVDKIKIDKAFIEDIHQDSKEYVIVTSILSLAQKLGVKVTAEGIETDEQAKLMMAVSCNELQGYLFSKPVPVDVLMKMEQHTTDKWKKLKAETTL